MNNTTELIVFAVLHVLMALIFGTIFHKAGCSSWWGLIMLVPVVNVIALIIFAASEWPVRGELARRRAMTGESSVQDISDALVEAARLERQGQLEQALQTYDRIAAMPDEPNAEYAANCAKRLQDRINTVIAQ